VSGLHHVELRPTSLRYYRRKDRKDCGERRRDAVIVDAKTRHRFKLDTKRMGTPSGGRWPMSALGQKQTCGISNQCPLYPQKRTLAERVEMSALRTTCRHRV
jgi:hypothetical protein